MTLPILYSLRNCPYAMRARLAIFKSKQVIELRDVVLSNKPAPMLSASPKGTVPTLVLPLSEVNEKTKVIDESLDVMLWALTKSDPENLLCLEDEHKHAEMLTLIHQFDNEFKTSLEAYKCAKRYHEINIEECRQACELYINGLEQRLTQYSYLMGNEETLADIALLPFIRQFSRVERPWYVQSPYPKLQQWLSRYLQSAMFTKVMAKYPLWFEGSEVIKFSNL